MGNSSPSFQVSIDVVIIVAEIIVAIVAVILSYSIYLKLRKNLEGRKIKEAKTLSVIGTLLIILTFATLYYASQNNSGMATATTTMVLVIITGFYAWNTHLQVGTMSEQADLIRGQAEEMRRQADTMERQFTLMAKNIKRDKITKEMNQLILPLKTIYQEIDSRGIQGDWWTLYLPLHNPTDLIATEKFKSAVDIVDQYKYLAPPKLYPLIDNFIRQLKEMKRSSDPTFQRLLQEATRPLFEPTKEYNVIGGEVEKRYNEIKEEMRSLDEDLLTEE